MTDGTEEEQKVIIATVQRLLDTVANRDKDGMREILLPEGQAIQSRDHQISHTPLSDLPEKMAGGTARLEERFYHPIVRVDDDIAMVWAHYDFLVNGDVHHWGTNILSFLKQEGRWRVSSVTDNGRSGPRPQNWEAT
jgi:Putative lumazine-binding